MVQIRADLILVGGRVWEGGAAAGGYRIAEGAAVAGGYRIAEGVAVAGERILAVGDRDEVMSYRGPGTEVVDLKGRAVLPGLIDSHCHIVGLGLARTAIDLNYPRARSIADICRLVAERAAAQPPGTWIRGRGYDHLRLEERRHPTRWDLDPVSGDHPVVLVRSCGHMSVANSEALRRAGITRETPDPPGGAIERRDGEPTGVLKEAAQGLVHGVAPHTRAELEEALRQAAREYLSLGVTAVHDMSGGDPEGPAVIQDLARGGGLGIRISFSLISAPPSGGRPAAGNAALGTGLHTGLGDHWVRLGPAKVVLDGSDDGATALMYRPYRDGSGTGIGYWQDEELLAWAREAARWGWQLSLHAIGDRAIDQALRAIAEARGGGGGEGRWRPRIEHFIYPSPEAAATAAALGVVPVVNPIFLSMVDRGYLELIDEETLARGFPIRSLLDAGLTVAAGSDAPVADANPLAGMACAVDRATAAGDHFRPGEAVSLAEALDMYTRAGAVAAGWGDDLGVIAPGRLADLVVLDGDLAVKDGRLTVTDGGPALARLLREMRVAMTVVGGQVRFHV
ncbi:MAG: amidohydrolase [Bacillota bacterium]|nr:amidohydrolase [Bacillota bacterium]MDI7249500.1 amidohydrolase [Bacillota bacterium]